MINFYRIELEKGRSHQEIMDIIQKRGRDNSRTPMQWNSQKNGGFTTADQTWLGVNPNYSTINVEQQKTDADSIYHFYKQMIALRKEHNIFTSGVFDLLLPDHPSLFAYTRTLGDEKAVIICNFSEAEHVFTYAPTLPEDVQFTNSRLVLQNYEVTGVQLQNEISLKPFETRVYLLTN
jgi:glycosidase